MGHREHSKRTKAEARSIGSFNGGSRGFLCPAMTPYLQVGVFATATRAPQGFGVAHDSGVIACEHPVVAGGTTVTAAVPGGGRVHRDGGALVLHSGDLFLVWLFISCAVDRTKQGTSLCTGPWVQLVTGRDVLAPYGTSHTVAAELRQRSRSHFPIPARSAIGQPKLSGWRSIDAFASHIIYQ